MILRDANQFMFCGMELQHRNQKDGCGWDLLHGLVAKNETKLTH